MAVPPGALRCPNCGHAQGQPVAVGFGGAPAANVEIGRRRPRRGVVAVAAAAVVLVGLLVFSGSGGSKQRAGADSTTTTTTVASTASTSTIPTTTTTSTLKPLALGVPTGIALAIADGGGVSIVELDTGVVHELGGSAGPPPVGVKGGFVISDGRLQWTYVAAPYDAPGRPLPAGSGFVYRSNDPARAWSVSSFSDAASASEIDLASGSAVRQIDIPPAAQVTGPLADGVALELYGGIFLAEPGSLRRLAFGRPIASGGDKVLFIGCDQAGTCTLQILDATTGVIVPVDLPPSGHYVLGAFSPDASTVALATPDQLASATVPVLRLVDTRTGALRSALRGDSPAQVNGGPVWSADGTWLFWPTVSGVSALQTETDALVQIDLGVLNVQAIAVVS